MPLSGMNYENGFGPGGTNICGIGLVNNKLCAINSNVGTKKEAPLTFQQLKRIQE